MTNHTVNHLKNEIRELQAEVRRMAGWVQSNRKEIVALREKLKKRPQNTWSTLRNLLIINDLRRAGPRKPLMVNDLWLLEKIYGQGSPNEMGKTNA